MKRNDKQRGNPPGLPRITNIEVARKNLPLRIILLVLALIIAFGAFAYGLSALLTTDPGWTAIESNSVNLNCSQDFLLYYNLGAGDISATSENKQLINLYTKATDDAYQLFYNEYSSEELHNIRYVNEHINQTITVAPAIYDAFCAITESGNRSIYLAPVYVGYQQIFLSENDAAASQHDPQRDPEQVAYIQQICQYANDPAMINIEILESQQIRLNVAQEYLDFVQENEINFLLDFSWMTNAFVADYIAQQLIDNGFTNGYIASYDGFTRNLCDPGETFELNVFHRVGTDILMPAKMGYSGGTNLVVLRDFPMDNKDRWHYYAFEDGRIANLMVDPANGNDKCAVSSLICYSDSATCSEILLAMSPLFMADMLDRQQLNTLKQEGIYSVFAEGKSVYYNDADVVLNLADNTGYIRAPIA